MMNLTNECIDKEVKAFCSKIGSDPLLVQGAGGNVSWKDGGTLWVKASGTWLAEAELKEIFVPVDLISLRKAIANGEYAVKPTVLTKSMLRPSIETLLHAIMPQPIVVHLHAVEILAHLVRANWLADIQTLLKSELAWTSVPYKKPGVDLAIAVSHAIQEKPAASVIFLQNHGVVVGGHNVAEVSKTLKKLTDTLRIKPIEQDMYIMPTIDIGFGYMPVIDPNLHRLAIDLDLFTCIDSQWALYPDHVVFLGASPHLFSSFETLQSFLKINNNQPDIIFLKDIGVFVKSDFSSAKLAQLTCYYEVLVRQQQDQEINTLLPSEIGELLNWDAEQYRMTLSKN